MIPVAEYVRKKRWNSLSGYVNANPVRLNDHFYGIPEDFFSPEVIQGSKENQDLRPLAEVFDFEQDIPPVPPLHRHLTRAIVSRIVGKTPSISKPIFSVQNHADKIYAWNPDSWCVDLHEKLTCLSVWNSQMANLGGGTLITKRHIVTAAHFPITAANAIFRFVDINGVVYERTSLAAKSHPDFTPNYPDFRVHVLNEDLPDSIVPCKILHQNWAAYLQDVPTNIPLTLAIDQDRKATVMECYNMNYIGDRHCRFKFPTTAWHRLFWENPVAFDSGQPYFYIINGELVLLGCLTGSVVTFLTRLLSDLNQLITDCDTLAGINTGYSSTVNDLTGFPIL